MKPLKNTRPEPPLILHVILRLAVGGLENGLVNLINALPSDRYRHAIVALTETTDFRHRIRRADVPILALHKREGHDLRVYRNFWQVLRELRPAVVHTRNFPTLEFSVLATLAGVRGRVHGEHGRDVYDLDGLNARYNFFRKSAKLFVHHYVAVSEDLTQWLTTTVGVPQHRVTHICNGVDIQRFAPRRGQRTDIGPPGLIAANAFVVGTVGRMQTVKDQITLARAFVRLLTQRPELRNHVRLVMIGDGPLRVECQRILKEGNVAELAWLPGERDDIPTIIRAFDLFILPSLAEGISNTILEAMASGVPVLATRVGGSPELVSDGKTGTLVPPGDTEAMANAMCFYVTNPSVAGQYGQAGRACVEERFSMDAMIRQYLAVYDNVLGHPGRAERAVGPRISALYSE